MEKIKLNLTTQLKERFGYAAFRGQQVEIMQHLLQRKDAFVIMPTGGGKSLCYQLPAVLQEGMAIVVSPLIALMKNQVDFLNAQGVPATFLNSSLSKKSFLTRLDAIKSQDFKLLYIAPETLNKEETLEALQEVRLSFMAIDEAHCISEWGHDFRPEYRKLRGSIAHLNSLPVIALTATATEKVKKDIVRTLVIPDARIFQDSFARPNLYYEVESKLEVEKQIIRFVKKRAGQCGIIYCQSRKKVEEIARLLQHNDVKAVIYHAGVDNATRNKNQDLFLNGKIDVIVATIAFGMGIDKANVRFIVHHDAPKSMEGYYQETGRAGRDGKESSCLLLYDPSDISKLEKFNRSKPVGEREKNKYLLDEVSAYITSGVCRKRQILHYFGEFFEGECGYCDNCRRPTPTYEGGGLMHLLLSTIAQLEGKFTEFHVRNVLSGVNDPYVLSHQHEQLSLFGKGKKDFILWPSIIRQALIIGFLTRDLDDGHTLGLTEKGKRFVQEQPTLTLSSNRVYSREVVKEERSSLQHIPELLEKLKSLRKEEAKRRSIKPYLVFQESALKEMATHFPTTYETMAHIHGVGMSKAKKFGAPFLRCLKKYTQENEIEVIDRIMVKPSPSKFTKKIQLIQQIDRKVNLRELTKVRDCSYDQLITDIEELCYAGVKVNLSYYLDTLIHPEDQEELYEYFHEQEEDNVEKMIEELKEDYEADEVRLMRVKFLSEVAY